MNEIAELVRTICHYNYETGEFIRVKRKSWTGRWYECHYSPKVKTAYGYLQMHIEGRPYLVHRLIFLYVNGEFPNCDVDHINGDRSDNRWSNLRLVSRQDNLRNQGMRADNKSGVVGVHFDKYRKLYNAYIGIGKGERINLGYFKTLSEAIESRRMAEIQLGYHPNHGRRDGWQPCE